jgi:hypothetical protein
MTLGDIRARHPLTCASFHNALRIMLNLEREELGLDVFAWETFQRDPYRWFIRASDADAERIWVLIEARQP